MKKLNTSPISGAAELLPAEQALFDRLKTGIEQTYRNHGYLKIETPVIDRAEILLAKAGGDTEKQIYFVQKSGDQEKAKKEALRFDHTVPLARYVVEHESALAFPFKVTQIGRNFRGEHAQKGRFREFYQCDIDIIGREKLAPAYDADIIATMLAAYETFHLQESVIARISNRKIVSGLIQALNLDEHSREIFSIIDHAEKVPQEKTLAALNSLGLSENSVVKITTLLSAHGSLEKVLEKLNSLGVGNALFAQGVIELKSVFEALKASDYADQLLADLRIVRGLDYYTGTVFEFALENYPEIGSIGGGGRYDNLTGFFTDQKFPGVGGSIGLSRLVYVLRAKNLLKENPIPPLDLEILPLSPAEVSFSESLAKMLRAQNRSVDVYLGEKRLSDKLVYAGKLAKFAVVVGEEEVETGIIKLKNMETGETQEVAADETLAYLLG